MLFFEFSCDSISSFETPMTIVLHSAFLYSAREILGFDGATGRIIFWIKINHNVFCHGIQARKSGRYLLALKNPVRNHPLSILGWG